MAFTPPPPVPQRGARAIFSGAVDAFLKWMAALPAQLDAFLARLTAIAAGGAYAIPFRFTTSTGPITTGTWLSIPDANTITFDSIDLRGTDTRAMLTNILGTSSSSVKAQLLIFAEKDPSRWRMYNVTAYAQYAAYGGATAQLIANSGALIDGENVVAQIQRTGDKGEVGNADKKVQIAPAPVNNVVTVDYRNGNCLKWSPAAGSTSYLRITNWPAAGTLGEFWIIGSNLGSAQVKMNDAPINWLRPDGTYANSDNINTNHGATLRPAGEDNILLWGTNGAVANGKVAR